MRPRCNYKAAASPAIAHLSHRRQLSTQLPHAYADTSADRPPWRPSYQQQHLTTSKCLPQQTHNFYAWKTFTPHNQQVRSPPLWTTAAQHHSHHRRLSLSSHARPRSGSHGVRNSQSPRQVYRRASGPRPTTRRSSAVSNASSGIARLRTILVSARGKRLRHSLSPSHAQMPNSKHTRSFTDHYRGTSSSPRFN